MSRTGQNLGRYSPALRSSRGDTVRNYKCFNVLLRVVLAEEIWKALLKDRTHIAAFTLCWGSALLLTLLSLPRCSSAVTVLSCLLCRSNVQPNGRDDDILHATCTTTAADCSNGPEQLWHRPISAGSYPSTNARRPHEPLW